MICLNESVLLSGFLTQCTQAADICHCHFVVSLVKPFISPSTELSFFPALHQRNSPICHAFFAMLARRIVWGLQSVSALLFDLLQNFFEGRFRLPLTLYSFLFFSRSIRQNPSCPCPSENKILPHCAQKCFASEDLPWPATMSLLFHNLSPLLRLQRC